MNLILTVLEGICIGGCQYYFFSHNERTIYLKKFWYFLLFFADYLLLILPGKGGNDTFSSLYTLFSIFLAPLAGWIGFHRKWKPLAFDLIYGSFLLLVCQGGIAAAVWLSYVLELGTPLLLGNIAMFCKIILLLLGTRLLTFFMGDKIKGRISLRQLLGILILPLFSLFYFLSLVYMNAVYMQLYGLGLIWANVMAILIMNLYFFYLIQYQFRSQRLEQELALFQQENELRYRYYEELDQKYQESRKVIHDMKNHLQAVEELYAGQNGEEGKQYVKDLYHMLNVLGEQHYTQNKMLNIILNEKLRTAKSKGITVTVRIGEVDLADIKEIDMTTIFANLLDNAIEAAEGFGENAFLTVKMDEVRDFRVVKITNSYNPSARKERGRHMGLGLENVRNTLKKYHGSIQVEENDGEYRVHFMLPGKESI